MVGIWQVESKVLCLNFTIFFSRSFEKRIYKDFGATLIIYFLLFINFYTHENGGYGNLLKHWTNKSCLKIYIKRVLGTVPGSI